MRPLRQNAPVKPSFGHVRFERSFDFTRLRWQKGDNGGSRVVSWTRDVERSVGGAQRRASTFPSDSLRPRSAGDLVVDLNLPDLRLWRANFLERLTEPTREEAVEVLTRVPDVDDHETGVGLAGRMEGLALTELAPAFFELPHDLVVLLELAPGDVDQQTNGHYSSRPIA